MEEDQELAIFQRVALSSRAWAHTARSLKASAELLWHPLNRVAETFLDHSAKGIDVEPLRHSPAHLLLCGYALECMLKAAAIQRALNNTGSSAVLRTDGKRLQRWVTSHDTSDLVGRAGISDLSESDRKHLARFQQNVEWAGRYPTDHTFESPYPRMREGWSSWDQETFERLFGIVEEAYAREAKIRDRRKNDAKAK